MSEFKDIPGGNPDIPPSTGLEIKANNLALISITGQEVKNVIDVQYRKNFEPIYYFTQRGVGELLGLAGKGEVARLPDLPEKKAAQIFRDLPKGSGFLDVGCGSGTFIKEVLDRVNPDLEAYGFDSRTWEKQEELAHLKLGNIDDLSSIDFGRDKFDIVTCAAVLQHLPDYWGAILRMANRLNPKGVLLTSCIPRVNEIFTTEDNLMVYRNPVDDEVGKITKPTGDLEFGYFNSRNIFDVDGKIVAMADAIETLNSDNLNFKLRYSVAPGENLAIDQYGGQIAAVREGTEPLNLSSLYYCHFDFDKKHESISYILGKTENERKMLQGKGFMNVQERFDK